MAKKSQIRVKAQRGKDTSQRTRKKRANSATQGIKFQLVTFLTQHSSQSFDFKELCKRLLLKDKKSKIKLEEYVQELVFSETIIKKDDGSLQINTEPDDVTGTIDFVNANFAFLVSPGVENDLWISSEDLMGALNGDKVKAHIYETGRGKKLEGKVVEILERAKDTFVGKIQILAKYAFVTPDTRKMFYDIFVPKDRIGKAKDGDKVIVKISKYPEGNDNPEGVVTQVLGKAGEHNTEIHAIMAEYGLPFQFTDELESEAGTLSTVITESEINKRRDFRNISTFTIDPEDAKDFDDALSFEELPNGNYEIGVHIADVTHYILPDTELEKEAYKRATSVYLVDRTIPMLPEKLSNELCSLRPNEDKLTFSAVFEIDKKAKIIKEWFGRTVIHSNRRFSYEQAQEIMDANEGEFVKELLILNDLAKKMRDERMKKGAISFETDEVKFKLDEKGTPLSVYLKIRKDTHKLIEEFMLLANKKVAEFVYNKEKGKNKLTMVYRVHERPDQEKLKTLSVFVKKLGYNIETEGNKISQSLNEMMEQAVDKPEGNALQNLAIRTMAKARYSTEPLGHFGLAFSHYSHFTSPIRRYPDMMAHRLLQIYLNGGESASASTFEEKCKHSSEREKNAADAERASIKYKQVELMHLNGNGVFEGVVTGVTEFGVYVELVENHCEGLVRMADIGDDFYEHDPKNYRIVGKHTGNIISFGEKVFVKVKSTNLEKRNIDLIFVKNLPKSLKNKGTDSSSEKTENLKRGFKEEYGFDL